MQLFSRSFIVVLAVVAASMVGLFFFSRVLIPLLDKPVGDGGITHVPSSYRVADIPDISPTAPPLATPEAPTRPAIGPGRGFQDLENAPVLEQRGPQAALVISSLAWIEDGVVEEEREAAEALIYLAATSERLFDALAAKSWLDASDIRRAGPVIIDLEYIAYKDEGAALKLVDMPFLDTLQPPDALAIESLSNMAYVHLPSFQRVIRHPSLSDGIVDDEARIVALLNGEYAANPSLVNTLLDPNITSVEERDIVLPLAGETTLAVIRTSPGASRSLDLLANAVRDTEALMGEPFPASYVPLLFADAVTGAFSGSHNGSHIAIMPDYDVDDGSPEALQAGAVIAHEVAHYYWRWSQPWLDEGAAEFIAAYVDHKRSGLSLEPVNYPCDSNQTIRRLEGMTLYTTDSGYVCNYAVGERFFLDLYRRLGEETFWNGLRLLYRDIIQSDNSMMGRTGIDQVRRAFTDATAGESSSARQYIIEVIDRWYRGQPSETAGLPDTRPVVPELPAVYGWVNRAYVSLAEGGSPVESFSATEAEDWAWLTLEYSHDYAGPPQELVFEVVESYEDGFPYRRERFAITASRNYSGGVQWLSVGPGPDQDWATGRHWIYVYHDGRKVAQVEFQVTP